MNTRHSINVEIANVLEKVQVVNPLLYGWWYGKLYAPHGSEANWNKATLARLNDIVRKYNPNLS